MYKYYNINPKGETLPDCVTRAISLATGINYYDVMYELEKNGNVYNCDKLCVCCYSKFLEDNLKLTTKDGRERQVKEIVKEYPDSTLLLRIKGHLTCSINGTIYDIWDCLDKVVDVFWVV